MYTDRNFFIPPSPDKHRGCLPVLAVVNSATINTGTKVSFKLVFVSFGRIPRRGPYGSSVSKFLRSLHTVSHRPAPTYTPHQHHTRAPFSPRPRWRLFSLVF